MQNTYRYPALFEACEEGGYTVTFPDLPGIVTEGDTIDEAIAMAKEALALHILGMERDGDVFPNATNPAALPPVEGSFYSLVEAYLVLGYKCGHKNVESVKLKARKDVSNIEQAVSRRIQSDGR